MLKMIVMSKKMRMKERSNKWKNKGKQANKRKRTNKWMKQTKSENKPKKEKECIWEQ